MRAATLAVAAVLLAGVCLAAAELGAVTDGFRQSSGDAPDETPCVTWEPYTAWNSLPGSDGFAGVTSTWVVSYANDPCHSCLAWGDVLPCFATDEGVDVFGHRDFKHGWITRDYCRIGLPGRSTAYFSHHMMLPKAGPKAHTLKWVEVSLGDQVPDNVVRYKNRVLAQTNNASVVPGCCTGNGFSGWAEVTQNLTLTDVYIGLYTTARKIPSFNVAVCEAYHPPTPVPTAAPVVPPPPPPPTPAPTPIPPLPTPAPTPPPTPQPTVAPNQPIDVITRKSCLIGCDYNCTTYLYRNHECVNELAGTSTYYGCDGGTLTMRHYDGYGCAGTARLNVSEGTDTCHQRENGEDVTNKCFTVNPPNSTGLKVTKDECVEGCDYQCTTTDKPAGTCKFESPLYGSRGPVELQCWDDFISRTTYLATSCDAVDGTTLSVTTVVPRDKCVPESRNTAYVTWKCV